MIRPFLVVLTALGGLALLACSGQRLSPDGAELPAAYDIPVEFEEPDPPYLTLVPEPVAEPEQARQRVVVLDPGHGGDEPGAANHGVVEAHSNLDMAVRVAALLQAQDVEVILTRYGNYRVPIDPSLPPTGGSTPSRHDLQARVDVANAVSAAVFVSIHSNGSTSASERGVEVWFDSSRPFAAENLRLAHLLQGSIVRELRSAGFPVTDRGLRDAACFRMFVDRCVTMFVLGGPRRTSVEDAMRRGFDPALVPAGQDAFVSRATQMPGALVELLFVSNAQDAALLRNETARNAMARGVALALLEFMDSGEPGR